MAYGFVIDQTRCIGCHACTVACKSENDVPIGDFRTWVKYTEVGTFPTVRRHFSVLRCNHCTKAPCVTICPVTALNKRDDGIVDLDRDACIGCKACMQACPYDALYLNEETGGAEKCHYCAHRVDQGLEPACVVVCPEEAIVSGDFDDPEAKISKLRARPDAITRRAEQGTQPNVHYIGAEPVALDPGSATEPDQYLWSERRFPAPDYGPGASDDVVPDVRTVLDVNHKVHWGPKVSAYLVTKGIAAGAVMLAPLIGAGAVGTFAGDYLPELLGVVFLVVTLLLLVTDLKRPGKFLSLLLRPNTTSWLVLGAWVLGAFGLGAVGALAARALDAAGVADAIRYAGIPLGAAAAGYTAFLFAQCEGRDLWQNTRWLLPHLLAQAVFLGGLALLPFFDNHTTLGWLILIGGLCHAGIAIQEATSRHSTKNARLAASLLPRIPICGCVNLKAFPVGLAMTTIVSLAAPALANAGVLTGAVGAVVATALALFAFVGTFFYEQAYVRAGQLPPLS